jgi:SAM-dependent methyltransferase
MRWLEHPLSHVLTIVFSVLVGIISGGIANAQDVNVWASGAVAGYLTWSTMTLGILVLFRAPAGAPDVPKGKASGFGEDIRESTKYFWAVSSKELGLWSTPTFLSYLVLNGIKALTGYSRHMGSPLVKLSTDARDKEAFLEKSFDLAARVADGKPFPHYYYGLRLLVYPRHVYDDKPRGEVVKTLIRIQAICRVNCIPLELEKVVKALSSYELGLMGDVATALDQKPEDREPPPPLITKLWRKLFGRAHEVVIPDFLLVDNTDLWWYQQERDQHKSATRGQEQREACRRAEQCFRALCRVARDCVWEDYTPDEIGEIAVPDPNFFGTGTYEEWYEHIHGDSDHDEVRHWFDLEDDFLRSHIQPRTRVLDIGCGFGRHMILALESGASYVAGVDNSVHMYRKAQETMLDWIDVQKDPELRRQFDLNCDDAANVSYPSDDFDMAICMTNTLGNMPEAVQRAVLKEARRLLKPGGKLLLSVYKDTEKVRSMRVQSYHHVGLTVRKQSSRPSVVETVEGLSSEQFTELGLRKLLEQEAGFEVSDDGIRELGSVGLMAVATKSGPPAKRPSQGPAAEGAAIANT